MVHLLVVMTNEIPRGDTVAGAILPRMGAKRDRFAVWTYEEAGQEIPHGDPSVTDAERAAAGRETIAERWQALLPSNRSRAEAAYAAVGLPEGQEIARVWRPRDPAGLRDRLGEAPVEPAGLAVWAEDDILEVLWRGQADEVWIAGGAQSRLWPVAGTDDLWEASLRIRRLAEAVITVWVRPMRAGDDRFGPMRDSRVWRGPRSPADIPDRMPPGQPGPALRGTVEEHTLESAALGEPRHVTVYRPPGEAGAGAGGALPGCILADGQSTWSFARILEAAIEAGTVPPVLLVGVHHGVSKAESRTDRRAQEYLPHVSHKRFGAHLRFVADEVIPWASERFGPVEGSWVASGFSNGACWAVNAAQRRPDVFGAVAAFSGGMLPKRISGAARAAGVGHYLAAGTLERGFRRATGEWAERLRRAGLPCRHEEWVGGHDNLWWERQLPVGLGFLLGE